jgi:LmbE family N-acetylglucosaminyl deacetylase
MATIVAFHAHPDDEALLTGGTLARLAAGGHRVIIAVACDGAMGPATDPGAGERLAELRASAAILGVARVEHLGYAGSGHGPVLYPDPPDRPRFARAALPEAAGRLAALAAHRSQLTRRSRSGRVFRLLVRLPLPVFGLLLGHEWFTEPGLSPGGALRREIV